MIGSLVPAHILNSTRKDRRVERFGHFNIQLGFATRKKKSCGTLAVFCFKGSPVCTLLSGCGGGSLVTEDFEEEFSVRKEV